MKVRVYDKEKNRYFKSEVYAIINQGIYSRYLVLAPSGEKKNLGLFDGCDTSQGGRFHPSNIDTILHQIPEDWVHKEGASLLKVKNHLEKMKIDARFDHFWGYPWLLDKSETLASLLAGQSIAADEACSEGQIICSAMEGWNYVESQGDAMKLLDAFYGFHDSVLTGLHYISGSKLVGDGSMEISDSIKQATMYYDSQLSKSIEMVFEGVVALNLRPAQENHTSAIHEASILVKDETIFFYDDDISAVQPAYEGNWVKAYGLRWRYLPDS